MPALKQAIEAARSRFDATSAQDMIGQYQFMLSDADNYYLQIEKDRCKLHQGIIATPCVTLAMDLATFISLLDGGLNGMQAFMFGKITVTGDLEKATRLSSLFPREV